MNALPSNASQLVWRVPGQTFYLAPAPASPLIMGIVNVTPDSFSDGGLCLDPNAALEHATRLVNEGSDIIDVGGESTRPGSEPTPADVELRRVLPVVERLRAASDVVISIDTSKAAVARHALAAGAAIINDVSALRADPEMTGVAAESGAAVIVMHMLGTPKTMQQTPHYDNVVADVRTFLADRLAALERAGVAQDRVAVDPGLGFGKTIEHNLRLVREVAEFAGLGRPVCLGPSRKTFIGKLLDRDVHERLFGTIGACVAGYLRGAHILRVHDVAAVRDAIRLLQAIELGNRPA